QPFWSIVTGSPGAGNTRSPRPSLIHTIALASLPSWTTNDSSYTGSVCAAAHCAALLKFSTFGGGTVPSNRTSTWIFPAVAGSTGVETARGLDGAEESV